MKNNFLSDSKLLNGSVFHGLCARLCQHILLGGHLEHSLHLPVCGSEHLGSFNNLYLKIVLMISLPYTTHFSDIELLILWGKTQLTLGEFT